MEEAFRAIVVRDHRHRILNDIKRRAKLKSLDHVIEKLIAIAYKQDPNLFKLDTTSVVTD